MHTRAHAHLHLQSQWGKNNQKGKKTHSYMQLGKKEKKRKALAFISVMKNIAVESDHGIFRKTLWKLLQALVATFCLPKRLSCECLLLDKEQCEHMICK